ncbi:hypothetical protein DTO027B5_4913 [Paecilomyces variotii]|nr:hypothetical protein DTO027B3_6649 [Paecilomyces variotii]KAJ9333353.1 hypothetical protein DTO027B5_4913 [Paecilomyces variotii]
MLFGSQPDGDISIFHSETSTLLLSKPSKNRQDQISLLFNGHLQTIWTVLKSSHVPVYYKRKIFESTSSLYPGQFAVDFVVPPYDSLSDDPEVIDAERRYTLPNGLPSLTGLFTHNEAQALSSQDSKPMLVVLHGLCGGSHEEYLRHVLAALTADGSWEACVLNARGCSQTKITTGVLYHAAATWDLRQTVEWLRETFPNRPLFGIGFSLGANILATVCPLDNEQTTKAIGTSTRRLFEQHYSILSKNPHIDIDAARTIVYQHDFDRIIQCPTWGYPTERAYYRDASCVDAMLAIKIPFFALNAEDDPIATRHAIPYQEFRKTPYGVLVTTPWGGHLGWFERNGERWFVKPVCNFLNKMASEIDLESPLVIRKSGRESGKSLALAAGKKMKKKNLHVGPKPGSFDPMRRKLLPPDV